MDLSPFDCDHIIFGATSPEWDDTVFPLIADEIDWNVFGNPIDISQTDLSGCLSEALSLMEWAPEAESENLTLALEGFLKRVKSLKKDNPLNLESSQTDKSEHDHTMSEHLLVETKAATVATNPIDWNFEMVGLINLYLRPR